MSIQPGTQRIVALLSHFPPLATPVVHIAGTNGKGSVSAILDAVLTAAGLQTARFNSPHLVSVEDAIRLGGQPIPRALYDEVRAEVERVDGEHACGASLFELLTATALVVFERARADVVLVECGMGGVDDATNVFAADQVLASVLTAVDVDHQAFLGDSVEAIARAKAGIVKPGSVLVVGPQTHSTVRQVAEELAHERGADVVWAERSLVASSSSSGGGPAVLRTDLPLPGEHQRDNLALALAVVEVLRSRPAALACLPALGRLTDDAVVVRGVRDTVWDGRCSWLSVPLADGRRSCRILADGAHNPSSAGLLASYLAEVPAPPAAQAKPRTFVLSLSHSPPKTPADVLGPLLRKGDQVALVAFTTPIEGMPWVRPVPVDELVGPVRALVGDDAPIWTGALAAALEWARGDDGEGDQDGLVVVAGSLYLVADLYRLLRKGVP